MQDTSAAFVTLTSRKMQTVLAASELSRNARYWRTSPAPDPCDIIWANVSRRVWERVVRQIAGWAIFAALVVSFVPVVAFVQSLINLEAYAAKEHGAWARWLLDAPVLSCAPPPSAMRLTSNATRPCSLLRGMRRV